MEQALPVNIFSILVTFEVSQLPRYFNRLFTRDVENSPKNILGSIQGPLKYSNHQYIED